MGKVLLGFLVRWLCVAAIVIGYCHSARQRNRCAARVSVIHFRVAQQATTYICKRTEMGTIKYME